jgi:hypothetical protein
MQQHPKAVNDRVATPACGSKQVGFEWYVDNVNDRR